MESTAKKTFSRVGISYFVLMLLTQLLQISAAGIIAAIAPQLAQTDWYLWVLS